MGFPVFVVPCNIGSLLGVFPYYGKLSNIDQSTESGFLIGDGTPFSGFESVVVVLNISNHCVQIAFRWAGGDCLVKTRSRSGGDQDWGAWKQLAFVS